MNFIFKLQVINAANQIVDMKQSKELQKKKELLATQIC
jgi:hypothetical protein